MVSSITSYSRNGLRDWLVQRVTALVIAGYTITVLACIVLNSPMSYNQWQVFMMHDWMRIFTFMTMLSVVAHGWIGMWTVFTDYVKPTGIRLVLQALLIFALITMLVWCAVILWG